MTLKHSLPLYGRCNGGIAQQGAWPVLAFPALMTVGFKQMVFLLSPVILMVNLATLESRFEGTRVNVHGS